MFYLDEYHLKKKLHNSFNLHQSTKCVHLQSSLNPIFTLIVIFNLHTETDMIVFYEDGLPLKKKNIFIFSTGLHKMCSLADLPWVLYNFSFNSWYLIMSFHHANHNSRDNLDSTGCSKAAYLTPIKPLLKAIMAITKHISRKTFFVMLLYNQVYRIPVCVKSQREHQRVRKEISATF